MADNYTPTTEEVAIKYVISSGVGEESKAEFRRWLLAHDTTTRADQREQDARIAETVKRPWQIADSTVMIEGFASDAAAAIRATADEPEPTEPGGVAAMQALRDRGLLYPGPVDRLAVIREVIDYALEDLGDEGLAHTLAEHFGVTPIEENKR